MVKAMLATIHEGINSSIKETKRLVPLLMHLRHDHLSEESKKKNTSTLKKN